MRGPARRLPAVADALIRQRRGHPRLRKQGRACLRWNPPHSEKLPVVPLGSSVYKFISKINALSGPGLMCHWVFPPSVEDSRRMTSEPHRSVAAAAVAGRHPRRATEAGEVR
ncbi:uncharacterized protein LOC126334564 [Schistocerca gregaria]|uniref:uncharacterized protein LOC126334564 n=1 Tax=Schistocerca gregaria TaxID=7010 RepID=UPI00211F01E0|nr:uncharacterized protein LOC126334564 [Schistocerca gregaria]